MQTNLGKASPQSAEKFIRKHKATCFLGSVSESGDRRVMTTAEGSDLEELVKAFAKIKTAVPSYVRVTKSEKCEPCHQNRRA